MTDIETFLAYAAAFERAYESDTWDEVRGYFAEDAVYEVVSDSPMAGQWKGRDEIVRHLQESVNAFDRTYDERLLEIAKGPEIRDGAVWVGWSVTYKKSGSGDLSFQGEERAWVSGGKITKLKDNM